MIMIYAYTRLLHILQIAFWGRHRPSLLAKVAKTRSRFQIRRVKANSRNDSLNSSTLADYAGVAVGFA